PRRSPARQVTPAPASLWARGDVSRAPRARPNTPTPRTRRPREAPSTARVRPAGRWSTTRRRQPAPCAGQPASHRHTIFEVFKGDRPDAFDVQQVIDVGEASVIGAEIDDCLGCGRADARQGLQLFGTGGIHVDSPAGLARVSGVPSPWIAGRLVDADQDLFTVVELARQI